MEAETIPPADPSVPAPPPGGEEPPAVKPAAEEPPPDPDRVDFTLQLEGDQGTVTGGAESVEFRREDYAVLAGKVQVKHQDLTLTADRAEIDLETRIVVASGNVVLDQGPRRLTGATLTFDLGAKTGTLTEATAYVAPDYYFSGREIGKIGDDLYTVTDGVFTSCEQGVPDWSFRLGRAEVEVDGYARVHNAAFRVKKLPIFYTPYIVWPTKEDRTAGLLIPNFGYSTRRGSYLGLAYYQPIGRSYDATLFLDGYSEGFVGLGSEVRYHPSAGTIGRVEGYAIQDEERDEVRWKGKVDHVSDDLPLGLRGVIDWTQVSDFQFFQDFERDFDRNSRRFDESKAFLAGSWGPHQANLLVSDRETFTGTRLNHDRQLPSVEYNLRSTPVVTTPLLDAPLYLSVESSLGLLSVDRSETYNADYARADLFPQLSLPFSPSPWLSFSLNAGYRLTWWGDSLETDPAEVAATGSSFSGESLSRTLATWGAEVIGPSFSRLFNTPVGPFSRFMHVVEPRLTYSFVDGFEESSEVPSFDRVDRSFSGDVARVSLTNRLKAKPAGEAGGSAREILTFELAQSYSFDAAQPLERDRETVVPGSPFVDSQSGPLEANLRFAPSADSNIRAEWTYSTLFNQLTSSAIAADYKIGRHDVNARLTTNFRPQDGETLSNQLRLGGGLVLIPNRLGLRASFDYDLEESFLQEQRYFLNYTAQCWSVRLEFRDFEAGANRDTDYRVAFTLKNVGTFLDLTGRLD